MMIKIPNSLCYEEDQEGKMWERDHIPKIISKYQFLASREKLSSLQDS